MKLLDKFLGAKIVGGESDDTFIRSIYLKQGNKIFEIQVDHGGCDNEENSPCCGPEFEINEVEEDEVLRA